MTFSALRKLRGAPAPLRLIAFSITLWMLFLVRFEPWGHHRARGPFESAGSFFWTMGDHAVAGIRYYAQERRLNDLARKHGVTISEQTALRSPKTDVFDQAAQIPPGWDVIPTAELTAAPPFAIAVLLPALVGGSLLAATVWIGLWCLDPLIVALRGKFARTLSN